MRNEVFYLNEEKTVRLKAYLFDKYPEMPYRDKRPTVIVCPGGGYNFCSEREADPVAMAFAGKGYNTFVLYYSVGEAAAFPRPLCELSRAVKFIRDNAEDFGVIEDQIAVCGFSAGGHLTASLGVYWNNAEIQEMSGCKGEENKPNALILVYPVISSSWPKDTGEKVASHIVGEADYDKIHDMFNLQNHVSNTTPSAFICHTFRDGSVPVEDSISFANALAKNNIPFELHIFPNGGHGMSLAQPQVCSGNREPDFSKWFELCADWLERLFTNPEEANAPVNRAPYFFN